MLKVVKCSLSLQWHCVIHVSVFENKKNQNQTVYVSDNLLESKIRKWECSYNKSSHCTDKGSKCEYLENGFVFTELQC